MFFYVDLPDLIFSSEAIPPVLESEYMNKCEKNSVYN